MSETQWDLCPLKTDTHRFVLNTKPFLTDIWELRYLQNKSDKKGILLDSQIKNSIKTYKYQKMFSIYLSFNKSVRNGFVFKFNLRVSVFRGHRSH